MPRTGLLLGTWVLLMAGGAFGCGGADGGEGAGGVAIADQPLTGKIGGQPFTVAGGETDAFLSMDGTYFVNLYGVVFTACAFGGAPFDASAVILRIPKAAGTYKLGLNQTATLYDGAVSFNHVATRGAIVIDSIDGTTISGGASITFNADNTVNGKFTATICPE
jgi:hypothetical protein